MNVLKDNDDPKWTASRIDIVEPKRVIPYTDSEEPIRAKLRTDMVDPM